MTSALGRYDGQSTERHQHRDDETQSNLWNAERSRLIGNVNSFSCLERRRYYEHRKDWLMSR